MMKNLLIVDDDRVILNLLADGLRDFGYRVATAVSAGDALGLVQAEDFDLAILDLRMPEVSGMELARTLRANGGPPFVFLSAFGDGPAAQEAAIAGAMGYLVKPVDIPQLPPMIEASLARAQEIMGLRKAATNLEKALSVEQKTRIAVGILMVKKGLDRQEAFEYLRARARAQRRKLGDLSEEMIGAIENVNSNFRDA